MSLWAITCLFNPAGYAVRTVNYRRFRHALEIPIVAVELAFDEPFALRDGDADILIQVRGGAKLWQKERLLELAFQALPSHCDAVAWVDADMLGLTRDWERAVLRELEDFPIVQAYDAIRHLPETDSEAPLMQPGIVSLAQASPLEEILQAAVRRSHSGASVGHAWAARKDCLEFAGFYDGHIIGGGDNAMMCGILGKADLISQAHQLGEEHDRYYRDWADRALVAYRGSIGVVPGTLDHLYHGRLEDRQSPDRHMRLRAANYDPYLDIVKNNDGIWAWTPQGERLEPILMDYFRRRHEDSAGVTV
jgi:hypothetical protein